MTARPRTTGEFDFNMSLPIAKIWLNGPFAEPEGEAAGMSDLRERIRGVIGDVAESAFAGGMDAEAAYRDGEDVPDYRNDKNAAADKIIAAFAEAMMRDDVIQSFHDAEAAYEYDQFDGWFQAYQAGMMAALDTALGE